MLKLNQLLQQRKALQLGPLSGWWLLLQLWFRLRFRVKLRLWFRIKLWLWFWLKLWLWFRLEFVTHVRFRLRRNLDTLQQVPMDNTITNVPTVIVVHSIGQVQQSNSGLPRLTQRVLLPVKVTPIFHQPVSHTSKLRGRGEALLFHAGLRLCALQTVKCVLVCIWIRTEVKQEHT